MDGSPIGMPAAAPLAAAVLACVLVACGDDPGPSRCGEDAGALITSLVVAEGAECASTRLSVPIRERLTCGDLPADFGGARVALRGNVSTRWAVYVERTDGSPEAVCAAVLDSGCRCSIGQCTNDSAERLLTLDLGTVEREQVDVVFAPGTYSVELCSR